MRSIRETEKALSAEMDDVRLAWNRRLRTYNQCATYFGPEVKACLDVMAIKVSRPSDSKMQRYCYNGKYS